MHTLIIITTTLYDKYDTKLSFKSAEREIKTSLLSKYSV